MRIAVQHTEKIDNSHFALATAVAKAVLFDDDILYSLLVKILNFPLSLSFRQMINHKTTK